MGALVRLLTLFAAMQARRAATRAAEVSILVTVAVVFILIGLGGFLTALAIWLVHVTDPISAALIIGGGAMVLAGVFLLLARSRAKRSLFFGGQKLAVPPDLATAIDVGKANAKLMATWAPIIGVGLLAFMLGRGGGGDKD